MNSDEEEGGRDIHDRSSAGEGTSEEKERICNKRSTFNIDEERLVSLEVADDVTGARNRGENISRRRRGDCH